MYKIFFLFLIQKTFSFIKTNLKTSLIKDNLHVIIVFENPCLYVKRRYLTEFFLKQIQKERNIKIYVVELCYAEQIPVIIDPKNPNHIAIYTGNSPLWHKENLINIGVKKLLPKNWEAFAWIDSDIKFDNPYWALETLKFLKHKKDIVQLFSHVLDPGNNESYPGFAYERIKIKENKFFRPGGAWAINRKAYERIGGIFDYDILGNGDTILAYSMSGYGLKALPKNISAGYRDLIVEYQKKVFNLKFGFIPGNISQYYHGSRKNRNYGGRTKLFVKHQFDPIKHLIRLKNGLIEPSKMCPKQLLDDIYTYFKNRKEDD